METLKIEIPKGYEVQSFNEKTGEIKFRKKPKEVTERIKDFKDVLDEHGLTIGEFTKSCLGLSDDEIAYRKIKLIAESLNEGWEPDWGDSNQYKYYPWFDMGSSSGSGFAFDVYDYWCSDSYCGSRLCFKTSKLARYAGEQFTDIYKEFLIK